MVFERNCELRCCFGERGCDIEEIELLEFVFRFLRKRGRRKDWKEKCGGVIIDFDVLGKLRKMFLLGLS